MIKFDKKWNYQLELMWTLLRWECSYLPPGTPPLPLLPLFQLAAPFFFGQENSGAILLSFVKTELLVHLILFVTTRVKR